MSSWISQNKVLVISAASVALVSLYWLRRNDPNEEGCCPKNSIMPSVPSPETSVLGAMQTITFPHNSRPPLEVYVTGTQKRVPERLVIVCTDIFGIHGGQKKQVCDAIASRLGCQVAMPDLFRGDVCTLEIYKAGFVSWAQQWQPSGVVADLTQVRSSLLKDSSACGIAGFCWGTWAALQAAAVGQANSVVLSHPSHRKVCANVVKEDCDDLLRRAASQQLGAVLMLPAGNDDPAHKRGGADEATLRQTSAALTVEIEEFPDMTHGWVLRGDVRDPNIAKGVGLAVDRIVGFFENEL